MVLPDDFKVQKDKRDNLIEDLHVINYLNSSGNVLYTHHKHILSGGKVRAQNITSFDSNGNPIFFKNSSGSFPKVVC